MVHRIGTLLFFLVGTVDHRVSKTSCLYCRISGPGSVHLQEPDSISQ